jgi:hypothetical protein
LGNKSFLAPKVRLLFSQGQRPWCVQGQEPSRDVAKYRSGVHFYQAPLVRIFNLSFLPAAMRLANLQPHRWSSIPTISINPRALPLNKFRRFP